jgi:hypothetical protein
MTTLRSAPPASSPEACAPRRSWKRTCWRSPDRSIANSQTRVRKVLREMGAPVPVEKEQVVVALPLGEHVLADRAAQFGTDHDFAVFVVLGVVAEDVPGVGTGDLLRYFEDDALHEDNAAAEVDVDRPQRGELAPEDAGLDRYEHHRWNLFGNLGEESRELLGGDGSLRLLDQLRQHCVPRWVDRDDLVDDRPLEDRVQERVVLDDRPRAQTGGGCVVHPCLNSRGGDVRHLRPAEAGDEVLVEVRPVRGARRRFEVLRCGPVEISRRNSRT